MNRAHHSSCTIQLDPPRNFNPRFCWENEKTFSKFLKEPKLDDEKIINKCQEVAVRTSYFIHCRRRKEWTDLSKMHNFI